VLPDNFEGPPDKAADDLLDFFNTGKPGISGLGGSMEPLADEDGVLLSESDAAVRTLDVAALDADIEAAPNIEPSQSESKVLP
jgi:type IV secretion system protein VirD4